MKGLRRTRLSLIERAVLEAVMRCPRPQLRCLMRKVRQLYPKWGMDKEDITWGVKRLRASGILSGRFGKQGRSAILYRMANSRRRRRNRVHGKFTTWQMRGRLKSQLKKTWHSNLMWFRKRRMTKLRFAKFYKQIPKRMRNSCSAAKRRARVLKGPGPRAARRLLRRYYRRRNSPYAYAAYVKGKQAGWGIGVTRRRIRELKAQAKREGWVLTFKKDRKYRRRLKRRR